MTCKAGWKGEKKMKRLTLFKLLGVGALDIRLFIGKKMNKIPAGDLR